LVYVVLTMILVCICNIINNTFPLITKTRFTFEHL